MKELRRRNTRVNEVNKKFTQKVRREIRKFKSCCSHVEAKKKAAEVYFVENSGKIGEVENECILEDLVRLRKNTGKNKKCGMTSLKLPRL